MRVGVVWRPAPVGERHRSRLLGVLLAVLAVGATSSMVAPGIRAVAADTRTPVVNVARFGARPGGAVDAAPAIERAIESLPGSGGVVTIPRGVYLLGSAQGSVGTFPDGRPIRTALVISRDHVVLRGAGPGTVLRLGAHAKWRALTVTGRHDVVEDLSIDGNKAHRDGRRPYPHGDTVDSLLMGWEADHLVVRDCVVDDGIEDGIGMWRATDVLVTHCRVLDNGTRHAGGSGIALSAGSRERAVDNTAKGNSAAGIWVAFGSRHTRVVSNKVLDNAKAGISVSGVWTYVVGNVVRGNGRLGFAGIAVVSARHGLVQANRVDDNAYVGVQLGSEKGRGADGWVVRENACAGSGSRYSKMVGIEVFADARAISLTGNDCRGKGPGPGSPIVVHTGARVNANWKKANTAALG